MPTNIPSVLYFHENKIDWKAPSTEDFATVTALARKDLRKRFWANLLMFRKESFERVRFGEVARTVFIEFVKKKQISELNKDILDTVYKKLKIEFTLDKDNTLEIIVNIVARMIREYNKLSSSESQRI